MTLPIKELRAKAEAARDSRLFPECIGTTQLAPTNSQCNACKRYGQRCDRKEQLK